MSAAAGSSSVVARVCDVTMEFGHTVALHRVDLSFSGGEIHTLVGENGAGKSTLLRLLAGLDRPTRGTVEHHCERIDFVPQETGLAGDLTVTEWIFLGRELRSSVRLLQSAEMERQAEAALAAIGARIPSRSFLHELAGPQRKLVQLARALHRQPQLLLVDEPTAVLGTAEAEQVFAALRRLRDQGSAIVYVSHHLSEVLALADRVTVLRDGRIVSTDSAGEVDEATLVQRMVGRNLRPRLATDRRTGDWRLRCRELSVDHVDRFSITLNRGEIVGLAGLVGAGRSEVLEAIAGLRQVRGGTIETASRPLLLPEDRGRKGLVAPLVVRENVFLPASERWVSLARERLAIATWIEKLRIRASSGEAEIGSLSGGNQQKVLMARTLRRAEIHGSDLLLFDQPTAGIDVGAKGEIHEVLRSLAAAGAAILLASSELPELLELCDRVIALYRGRVAGELSAAEASEERLAAMITGASGAWMNPAASESQPAAHS